MSRGMSRGQGSGVDASGMDVSVVSCAHDLADARLHRICGALRRAGLTVEVTGLGEPEGGPPGTVVRSLGSDRGQVTRLRNAATLPFRARGRVLITLDPDLVGTALAWRGCGRGRAVVADVHEDYLSLLRDRAWARSAKGVAARAVARTATVLARRTDLTVVADAHLPPLTARHRLVVRNLPDLAALPAAGEPGSELEPEPRALYVGDVRASRGLRAMIAAVAAAPPWRLDIVGPVAAADAAWLAANPPGERVRLHGRLPLERAWALARGAWAGMCLLEDTPAFREAVPTKLYEYLGSGLAVLATPLPRMASIVAESGGGCVVAGVEEASSTLSRWYAEPTAFHRHRKAARHWAELTLTGPPPFDELAREVQALIR